MAVGFIVAVAVILLALGCFLSFKAYANTGLAHVAGTKEGAIC